MEDSAGTGAGVESTSEVYRTLSRKKALRLLSFLAGVLLLLSEVLFLLFYFTLPCFRLVSRSVEGNEFLSKEDLLVLSEESPRTSYLFYDGEEGEKKLRSYPELVLEAKEASTPFSSSLRIVENVPFFSYQGVKYFKDGTTEAPFLASLSKTPLSEERKKLLRLSYQDALSQDLCALHLPKGMDPSRLKDGFSFLSGLPNSLRSSFTALQFRSDSQDSRYADVFDLILKDSQIDGYVLFPALLYDQVPSLFRHPERLENAFQSIEANIQAGKLTSASYVFEDDETVLEKVYTVHVSVTSDSVMLYR